jgi:hypothetical protein
MKGAGIFKKSAGFMALTLAVACTDLIPTEVIPDPPVVEPIPQPEPEPIITEPSAESQALATYYRRLQNDLLTQGLLRGDGGGPDTPFTDTMLARNFVRIALFDEYITDGDVLRPQATLSRLRRWEQPIRMTVEFGASVPEAQRLEDSITVSAFAQRLSRVSGLPIDVSNEAPNFHVLVLNEDDRLGFEDRLKEIIPGIARSSIRAFIDLPREQLCIVIAFSEGGASSYSKAVALIRGEHPDLLRTSCFHEELAQGLGLANDSPQARPSIFNDDEEFGLLTTHDELLLKMLYDPRLVTGMSAAEAAPIARVIAREILESGPS